MFRRLKLKNWPRGIRRKSRNKSKPWRMSNKAKKELLLMNKKAVTMNLRRKKLLNRQQKRKMAVIVQRK